MCFWWMQEMVAYFVSKFQGIPTFEYKFIGFFCLKVEQTIYMFQNKNLDLDWTDLNQYKNFGSL